MCHICFSPAAEFPLVIYLLFCLRFGSRSRRYFCGWSMPSKGGKVVQGLKNVKSQSQAGMTPSHHSNKQLLRKGNQTAANLPMAMPAPVSRR
ncbi:hypothetical protein NDU88_002288 [Pleurodeles waltl]|uniref:Secreted protein n=1 Tax=Pleurodeles waltl TaxID=8319 RepID=A0AAV7VCF4_PLEWA|nr:hypothetical protein NDU88_002288 [Pleurodeles waltl]